MAGGSILAVLVAGFLLACGASTATPAESSAPPRKVATTADGGAAADIMIRCRIEIDGTYRSCRVLSSRADKNTTAGVLAKLESMRGDPVRIGGVPTAVDYTFSFRIALPATIEIHDARTAARDGGPLDAGAGGSM